MKADLAGLPDKSTIGPLALEFENWAPEDILAWVVRVYGHRAVLACSFGGPSGVVTLDMAMRIDSSLPVYYLDTALLFPETYELVRWMGARYKIKPIRVHPRLSVAEQAAIYGPELWKRNPDICCAMRKVEPQLAFLGTFEAWISGIRRDQSRTRAYVPVIEWDTKFDIAKVNPLATWSERMVWTYIRAHELPYNALHDRGFPSIGCRPCTRPVAEGEDLRAGRWPGFSKIECGLHVSHDSGDKTRLTEDSSPV